MGPTQICREFARVKELPPQHVQALVAFLLIGVENIGIQIEQPFSVLPLELFCSTIKTNVIELLAVRPFSNAHVRVYRISSSVNATV